MQPPLKIGNCRIWANFWFAKNCKIFEDALVRPGPLVLNFKQIQIDRPTNPLFPYVTYTAGDFKMAILTEKRLSLFYTLILIVFIACYVVEVMGNDFSLAMVTVN